MHPSQSNYGWKYVCLIQKLTDIPFHQCQSLYETTIALEINFNEKVFYVYVVSTNFLRVNSNWEYIWITAQIYRIGTAPDSCSARDKPYIFRFFLIFRNDGWENRRLLVKHYCNESKKEHPLTSFIQRTCVLQLSIVNFYNVIILIWNSLRKCVHILKCNYFVLYKLCV